MALDAYTVRDLGDGTHDHPHLTAATITLAAKRTTSRKHLDAMGRPMVLSYDSILACGHRVSTLTEGARYSNATGEPVAPEA